MTTSTACPDCSDDTDHCHDTLILHADHTIECSDGDCVAVTIAHLHVISCTELSPRCQCDGGPA